MQVKHLIRKCPKCNSYTLKFSCEKCKVSTIDAHPARYSPDDKYSLYRISDRYIQAVEVVEVDQENSRE